MPDILDELLALEGKTRADLQLDRGPLSTLLKREGIEHGPTLDRILALPRREPLTDELINQMSAALRVRDFDDNGEPNRLLPAQAEALRECFQVGGLFAPMRCGSGKTLVTFLLPHLLGAQRPVLVAPAALIRNKKGSGTPKTQREFAEYRRNWYCRLPRLVSYEELGREDRENLLTDLRPDLLMLDEGHKWRTKKRNQRSSAMARRITRSIEAVRPVVAVLSGTLITDRLLDYQPACACALGVLAPCPTDDMEAQRWGQALDRDVGSLNRIEPGALNQIPGDFHEWMRGSRGVVSTPGKDCNASIEVSIWQPTKIPELAQLIEDVMVSGMRPDGELLEEMELPTCLSQLALGFFYRWDPMPPDDWLYPRRAWLSYAREVLDMEIPGLDSEGQLRSALRAMADIHNPWEGNVPNWRDGLERLDAWLAVRDTFEPNSVAHWFTEAVVKEAATHAIDPRRKACLVWTRFRAIGDVLEKHGVPYFGGGTNPEPSDPSTSIAVSIQAHATGKNLQSRSRALVLTPPANAHTWEQLIAREHRKHQKADLVQVEIIGSIPYHGEVLTRVMTEARAVSKAAGENQKLVDATWI